MFRFLGHLTCFLCIMLLVIWLDDYFQTDLRKTMVILSLLIYGCLWVPIEIIIDYAEEEEEEKKK